MDVLCSMKLIKKIRIHKNLQMNETYNDNESRSFEVEESTINNKY